MKKRFVTYPLVAAAFPVLAVYSANLSLCSLRDLVRPLALAIAGAALVWCLLRLLLRSWERSAIAATVLIAATYSFAHLAPKLSLILDVFPSADYWIVTALLMGLAAWKFRWHSLLTTLANILLIVNLGMIALGEVRIARAVKSAEGAHLTGVTAKEGLPDIYYIILDGYGGEDELGRIMEWDNKPFLDGLRGRGFFVADRSHSNYVQTEISLASSLNMDLIPALLPHETRSSGDRVALDILVNNNAMVRTLHASGYKAIAIKSGFPAFQFSGFDLVLGNEQKISLLEGALLQMTPFDPGERGSTTQFDDRRDLINGAFDNLALMASETSPRPRFIFAHILAPHPPFVFGPHGEKVPRHGSFGLWDGSDFIQRDGDANTYRSGYVGQLQYLNSRVLPLVDDLISRSARPPIIVIQGDHGSKLKLDQNSLARTDVTECFNNLMAYYVPEEVRSQLYPGITPVNSFPIILNSVLGEHIPTHPDRSWYSPFDRPYEFTDVTDRVNPPGETSTSSSTR